MVGGAAGGSLRPDHRRRRTRSLPRAISGGRGRHRSGQGRARLCRVVPFGSVRRRERNDRRLRVFRRPRRGHRTRRRGGREAQQHGVEGQRRPHAIDRPRRLVLAPVARRRRRGREGRRAPFASQSVMPIRQRRLCRCGPASGSEPGDGRGRLRRGEGGAFRPGRGRSQCWIEEAEQDPDPPIIRWPASSASASPMPFGILSPKPRISRRCATRFRGRRHRQERLHRRRPDRRAAWEEAVPERMRRAVLECDTGRGRPRPDLYSTRDALALADRLAR